MECLTRNRPGPKVKATACRTCDYEGPGLRKGQCRRCYFRAYHLAERARREPTDARPGTAEKLAVLRGRAERLDEAQGDLREILIDKFGTID